MSRNRLGDTASPYLRQHAENPVHWWPWSANAFAEAEARNVPVHLSIGYAACHWCHVMAGESFSDPAIAALLNDRFVNIKVDREERPDIDQIYMKALHAMGEQGGWPLTMFISPDGEPFWGGTYFPPEPRWGRPGFPQLLESISAAWQRGDETIATNRKALVDHLSQTGGTVGGNGSLPDKAILDRSAEWLLSIWDHDKGGIRGAPKFPMSPVLELLSRAAVRNDRDNRFQDAVMTTLTGLCSGGIYDHLAGGFARYSVDEKWLVPHFEKMLSDNGQLLWLIALHQPNAGGNLLHDRMTETADWLIRGMQLPGGGFAASLDADTGHEEGLTYVWTKPEVDHVLGPDSQFFCEHYDVTDSGNWDGKSILNRLVPGQPVYAETATEDRLRSLRARLLDVRNKRSQPARDEKVLADWNGVTITALTRAFEITGQQCYLEAAQKAFHFITGSMQQSGRLCHAWCDGRITATGLATDYAQMIRAAIALHAATNASDYLQQAEDWFSQAADDYTDSGTVYLTPADTDLIVRPVSVHDEAMPAAAGILVQVAMPLFMLTGTGHYRATAEAILGAQADLISKDVIGSASLQSGFDSMMRGRLAYLSTGPDSHLDTGLKNLILSETDPAMLFIQDSGNGNPPKPVPAGTDDGVQRLYLCEAASCRAPVNNLEDAKALLNDTRRGIAKPG